MFSSLKIWLAKRKQDSATLRIILLGIDYPSHRLGTVLQRHGLEIIAFIDEEPWNHRTKMLGATVHYPSELAALVERYKVGAVVSFTEGNIELHDEVQLQLKQLNTSLIEIDAESLSVEAQAGQVLSCR